MRSNGAKSWALRRCTHLALAEREYNASARIGCVRSDLSLLFATNPGEGFAEVRVDAFRVAERGIEDGFHTVSCFRLVRCTLPTSRMQESFPAAIVAKLQRVTRVSRVPIDRQCKADRHFAYRITQTDCAAPFSRLLRGFSMTTNGRREEISVRYFLPQLIDVNLPQVQKYPSRQR
jgi:hypothetical protein